MTFNFWSLDYIYYPVSGIMWVWHKVFGAVLGPSNAWAWVLSVVFLVFTLRAVLFKPFLKQMDSQLKMQAVQPEMKKLREKYKGDRQRLSEEMMKLNKEAGVNPLSSCLPALMQAPVFIGLFHVLRLFKPGWGQVYFFGKADVQSFVDAKLFDGAPLSSFMTMPSHTVGNTIGLLGADGLGGVRSTVIAVGVPLTILAGIATHLTSRRSVARQREMNIDNSGNPQAAIMNKLMLYLFPLFVVLGGPFFPLAILFYWLSNNTWTFGQLWFAHRMQDKKRAAEALVVEEAKDATKFSKPPPGARPVNPKRPLVKPASRPTPADGKVGTAKAGDGKVGTAKAGVAKDGTPADSPPRDTRKAPTNGSGVVSSNGSANGNGRPTAESSNGQPAGSSGSPPPGSAGSRKPKPGARPQARTGTTSKKKKPGRP